MPSGAEPDRLVERGPTWDRAAAATEVLIRLEICGGERCCCTHVSVVRNCCMHACENWTAQEARLLLPGKAQDRVNSEIPSI